MNSNIKPFWQWKQEILIEDAEQCGILCFRWTKDEFYEQYGHYVQKMRLKKCDCYLHLNQVCDICQDVVGKTLKDKPIKDKPMKPKFNVEADAYLKSLYDSVGATTPEQKYNTIYMKLGYHIDNVTINFSHDPSWEQKQAMMEYDILEREGLIQLIYA